MANKPELLNEAEAAGYITMSVAYLRAGRTHGVIAGRTPPPPFMRLGRSVRYERAALDAWLADRRVSRSARKARAAEHDSAA